jgi:lipoprotein NlpD
MQPGDTLSMVAKKYHVDIQDLAEVNNIEKAGEVKPGRVIYIPGAKPPSFAKIIEKESSKKSYGKKTAGASKGSGNVSEIQVDHSRFEWPIVGDLSSGFGMRHGRRHDGIDIRAKKGTPIAAAADGEVVYSKRMRGYGNLVLIKHSDDLFTVYAHNSVNLVRQGKKVKEGDIIAKVGSTGRATGPHLHFEVREGTKARNPLFFLPKNQYARKWEEGKGSGHKDTERGDDDAETGNAGDEAKNNHS